MNIADINLAYMLLNLAKENSDNTDIQKIEYDRVYDIQVYKNVNNEDDNTLIYCVYADCFYDIKSNIEDDFCAQLFFSVSTSTIYHSKHNQEIHELDVQYLNCINQH